MRYLFGSELQENEHGMYQVTRINVMNSSIVWWKRRAYFGPDSLVKCQSLVEWEKSLECIDRWASLGDTNWWSNSVG